MELKSLRPKDGMSLSQLKDQIGGLGWSRALPHSLPDATLLRLAMDFRRVENAFTPDTEPSEEDRKSLAVAMLAVMNVLIDHPQRSGDPNQMNLSDFALINTIKIYQICLEREIITRICGAEPSVSFDEVAGEMVRYANEQVI